MERKPVKTAVPLAMDRYTPPQQFAAAAQALAASGVVDYQQPWDQLTSWWPNALWNNENTPLADVVKDCSARPSASTRCATDRPS